MVFSFTHPALFLARCARGVTRGILVLLFLWMLSVGSAHAGLFGSSERKSGSLKSFPKWTDMLERFNTAAPTEGKDCVPSLERKCHVADWKRFLKSLSDKDENSQIRAVNDFMNKAAYVIDPINYGVPDYWATPFQFFQKDGDCEDYAIAKFISLRALGVSNDDMRVVVLKDENLNLIHSVLAVYVNDHILILDNQIGQVIDHTKISHYKPIYSINETNWWRHM